MQDVHAPLLTALSDPSAPDLAAAITIGADRMSRADLLAAAAAVADRIQGAGRAAFTAAATIDTVVAVVGCLLAGVTAVPIPADAGIGERSHILADSAATLWLGDAPGDVRLPVVAFDTRSRSSNVPPEPASSAVALILYTSGTTGLPKGVPITRAAIAACLDGLASAWEWTAADTLVHGLPLFHIHGLVLGVLGALRIGSPLVHTVRPTPEAYAAVRGSLYFGVPTVWSRVCEQPDAARALGSARLLVSGSAPLPAAVFARLAELTGSAPVERYGMTETLITVSACSGGERRPGWVGSPLPGVRTRLVDTEGDPVAADGETLGALEVSAPTVFDGYLHRPDATARSFTADGWFRTGDIAVVDSGGFHRIVGRESVDLIKSGGYRIGAGEIEQTLLSYPGIREAAVVGEPDDDLGQRIVAYVVGEVPDRRDAIEFVGRTLSRHKRPRRIEIVDELPRNAMGKVQKKLLGDNATDSRRSSR
ncbi:acyl-CoA synthetase [Nocardia sp. NPDC004582]